MRVQSTQRTSAFVIICRLVRQLLLVYDNLLCTPKQTSHPLNMLVDERDINLFICFF